MASVIAIRDGMATRLLTISGLRVSDYVPGQINPPAAVIIPGDPESQTAQMISFDSTMARGSDDMLFTVMILVSLAHDRVAHEKLDAYLDGSSATSVKAALDGNLGGVVSYCRVASCRRYGRVKWGNQDYLGAEFLVEVCT
ncbi:hypothetical protein [Streptomyces sp. NPDC002855]|uniref:hypothetical protein n=1 Tax=Streptomyces sp. NPDC002855 TaxID=3154437 RepID=UPI00332DAEEC